MGKYKIGIDVGGTFTDLVAVDMGSGELVAALKVPSTPANFVDGLMDSLSESGCAPADTDLIIHGTTIGTNSIIERTGARTLLVTTGGFRDVLLAQRGGREQIYDLDWEPQRPTIRRRDIVTVRERIGYDGKELVALNTDDVNEIASMVAAGDIESVGICFINSFMNPAHEIEARAILQEKVPDVPICISYELAPVMKEYERTNSTIINALLMPIMTKYLDALVKKIDTAGYRNEPLIIHSGGGVMTISATRLIPARTCLSGPAAGVMGGLLAGTTAGYDNIITLDMGGTSTDVSLCHGGKMAITPEWSLAYDLPILIPAVDVVTIGAGGGSIAWIDDAGRLRNGPRSAGASPGPMCYGQGGSNPTNSDAQLVLHRLNPETILGGTVRMREDLAREGIKCKVAQPLGMKSVEEAAAGILEIAIFNMVNTVRMVGVERGYDPTAFALLAFGGGGPLFGAEIARAAMIPTVIVPTNAGVLSAWGGLTADIKHDFAKAFSRTASEIDVEELNSAFGELDRKAIEALKTEGVNQDAIQLVHYADLKYFDQSVALTLKMPPVITGVEKDIVQPYEERQRQEFGYSMPRGFTEVELVNIRVAGVGKIPVVRPSVLITEKGTADEALVGMRDVYFRGNWTKTDIYDRAKLKLGAKVLGPAIIEEVNSTTVIPPDTSSVVDSYGNIIITV